ncbi:MAG TPA: hypothetical protein VFR35_09155 [Actinoplanes sp.]|nr:hypothetical protein [Actinoplanes sp.]
MPWRNWSDDDELLRDIGDAVRPGPHEQQVMDAGRTVFAFHVTDLDRALAALLYDSHMDGLAAVRGPMSGAPRNLVFALGELRVEIELSDAGIEGQLIPPEPGTVRLLDATGPIAETTADEVGCFAFPACRHGPIRIECSVADRRLATEWISN